MSLIPAVLNLRERASTACESLPQLPSQGIPAGTDAIARGAIEDASKLGNGAPRARTVIAELRPDAGGAEAGAAEAQMEASKGYHDAEAPCAESTRCWRWTRAVCSL